MHTPSTLHGGGRCGSLERGTLNLVLRDYRGVGMAILSVIFRLDSAQVTLRVIASTLHG